MYQQTLMTAWKIVKFESGPHEMPRSWIVLSVLLPILFICRFFTNFPWLVHAGDFYRDTTTGLIASSLAIIIYFFALWLILFLRHLGSRFLQTALAIAAVQILMYGVALVNSFVMLFWINVTSWVSGVLQVFITLPDLGVCFAHTVAILCPVIYIFILPRVFQTTFNTVYWKAFLINLALILGVFSLEGNLVRLFFHVT